MTKLGEYYSAGDGQRYLPPGWSEVTIADYRVFDYNNGNHGVEFILADDQGRQGKISHALTGKGFKRLAWFCQSFGLTQEEANGYDTEMADSHEIMVGRRGKVLREKVGQYYEITQWLPVSTPTPITTESKAKQEAEPTESRADDDSIPF